MIMIKELSFEDLQEGDVLPALIKKPSKKQLVMWAGASGDFNPIHYDKDFALGRGLEGVIVHGQLSACFLGQMLTDWAGEKAAVRKFSVSYKGMNYPGQTITCKGVVKRKIEEEGKKLIHVDMCVENEAGDNTLTGSAVMELV